MIGLPLPPIDLLRANSRTRIHPSAPCLWKIPTRMAHALESSSAVHPLSKGLPVDGLISTSDISSRSRPLSLTATRRLRSLSHLLFHVMSYFSSASFPKRRRTMRPNLSRRSWCGCCVRPTYPARRLSLDSRRILPGCNPCLPSLHLPRFRTPTKRNPGPCPRCRTCYIRPICLRCQTCRGRRCARWQARILRLTRSK